MYVLSIFVGHSGTKRNPHCKPKDAYVHPETVEEMMSKAKSQNWQIKPTHYIPAKWDGSQVTITGKKTRIG